MTISASISSHQRADVAAAPPSPAPPKLATARPESARRRGPALRWSWRLTTISGIDVYVHGTFLLLLAFVASSDLLAGRGSAAVMPDTLLILAVFTSVLLHELGHALTARRFGVRTHDITLLPIGGVARLDRLPDKPGQQLLVALAGPAVNMVIALLLFGLVRLLGGQVPSAGLYDTSGPFLVQLLWINVSLALFNLLPGYPMDGGRILRAILAMRMAPERATQTAARVGQGVALIFGAVGLFVNPLLMVIAVFVWLGAQAEHSASTLKIALTGLSVREGMITDFKSVSPTDPLSRAVELTLAGFQQDFPVLDEAALVGILTHADVLKGLAEHGADLSVQQAMSGELDTVSPSEALDGALTRLYQRDSRALMVVENEKLVGLVTLANIGELLALEAAGNQPGALATQARGGTVR
ncbi:MAG: site-2 protease family protein [Candidatus Schekmanbacteria bacterium]|nr:site-2 protease family protein [Candidatus Schekmanbacteria bacterium]